MGIIKISGLALFNLLVFKMFAMADNRGKDNNSQGLPADVSHLPGGNTSSGETIHEGGDSGSTELPGVKPVEERGGQPPQDPTAQEAAGDLGWSATGTPGAGGEIGQKAHDQKE